MSVMKAVVQDHYGPPEDVLRIDEVPVPDIAADEVLVRVRASSINPADWHLVRGEPLIARLALGLRGPENDGPGGDLAGTVEKVGAAVSGFSVGDGVLGAPMGSLASSGVSGDQVKAVLSPEVEILQFGCGALDRCRRDEIGAQIARGYRECPQSDAEVAWADESLCR